MTQWINTLDRWDWTRALLDRLRPLKHLVYGPPDIRAVFRELARCRRTPVRMVFDVGAARGDITARFVRAFPLAEIHAFEPQVLSFEHLYARWHRRHGVRTHPCGFLDRNGIVPMHIALRPDGSSLLPLQHYMAHDTAILCEESVPMWRLDRWCADHAIEHIDFLKIDVEGVELEVLHGATRMLHVTDNLFVEISPLRKGPRSRSHIEVFRLLADAGFVFMNVYQSDYWFSRDPEVLTAWFGN